MTAFKLEVNGYGKQAEVQLHRLGEPNIQRERITTLRRFPTFEAAVDWAIKWLSDRGFGYWCNIAWHQRMNHKYITLHPKPKGGSA